ncbi:hypothetical protein C1646_755674 [Rhizophagus diaphanus]|nr:hypothetical protein C1646_755674 [Rhizophagus diaphanus] [Rhizophagus sp. MUCL 43196]
MTGVEVAQEILSEEMIAILPVTAGQDKKYFHQRHYHTPPYDRSTENSESFDSKKVSNDNQSQNKNKNEGKDLAALEEEVRYLREVIKQGKLREINEETSSSKKIEQENSFRTSEEPSQDLSVDNITGPFNLIIPKDLLHEKQSTSISSSEPQKKQSTSISSSEPQEKQSTSTSPSQERQFTSISTLQKRQSTSISHEKQNMTLSSRPPVRIRKLHLPPLPFVSNTDSKQMDQKKHHCSESEQEYSDFEQDSDSKESSDSEKSSYSKPPRSDRSSKSGRSFSKRRSKSGQRSSSVCQQSYRRTQKYLNVRDMPETLKDSLRRELFWIIERILAKNQLNINKAIIYMIHARHKYRREKYLNKSRTVTVQDNQARRKHLNSCRNDKRLMRARMITNLQAVNDPLIRKFKVHELEQIKNNSAFHSPEVSETDTKNLNGKQISKVPKKRIRVYDDDFYEKEQTAPLRSPKWAVEDYQGSLKNEVEKACYRRTSDSLPQI